MLNYTTITAYLRFGIKCDVFCVQNRGVYRMVGDSLNNKEVTTCLVTVDVKLPE